MNRRPPPGYPFAALVGQDRLATALLLNLVSPEIGGVLVVGERGTAKSTAARGLADLAPTIRKLAACPFHCDPGRPQECCEVCQDGTDVEIVETPTPFVHLPIGATEDRLLGTLDLDRVLQKGERALQPGLLATAHRGVLYIDEVNLLADHLVDALLDASASGRVTIERDGLTASHASRFVLIGSMNPDEGRLRPQLLDRFGLTVEVKAPLEPDLRSEIVRRRLAFDAAPVAFSQRWEDEQRRLRHRIVAAREQVSTVVADDSMLELISRMCGEAGVEGLRADITMLRASRALAAWSDDEAVSADHVDVVKDLVLDHRRRERPPSRATASEHPPHRQGESHDSPSNDSSQESTSDKQTSPEDSVRQEQVFAPRSVTTSLPEESPSTRQRLADTDRGRRRPIGQGGEMVRSARDPNPKQLDVNASVRAAVERGSTRNGLPYLERADLHERQRDGRTRRLVIFVVDASSSMGARRRMELVKGAVLSLLDQTRTARDEVALIAFRGNGAEVVLPPCRDVLAAEQHLRELKTGGRTPLAHALAEASSLIERHVGNGANTAMLLALSDGRANVPLGNADGDPWEQALEQARLLGRRLSEIGGIARVYDTEEGFVKLGRGHKLAAALGGDLEPIGDLADVASAIT